MSKLTLSVDENVVARAKRYAKRQGTSISAIVEAYLTAVSNPSADSRTSPPVLRSVRGSLKQADRESYRRHLTAKYR